MPAGLGDPPRRRARQPGDHARAGRRARRRRSDVLVLLGPGSELGRARTQRRDDLARAVLRRWREIVGRADLLVEVVSHRLPGAGPGSSPHAARMAGLAHRAGSASVLTNAVRYADRADAPTVDVLDAARRLVPLDLRHVDRGNAEGFLKSGKQMTEVAEEICRFAGLGRQRPRGPAAAGAHPHGRRPVRGRPARRPRPGGGALPRAQVAGFGGSARDADRRCCGPGARPGSAGATAPAGEAPDLEAARRRARGDRHASASPPTSSPSLTSPT